MKLMEVTDFYQTLDFKLNISTPFESCRKIKGQRDRLLALPVHGALTRKRETLKWSLLFIIFRTNEYQLNGIANKIGGCGYTCEYCCVSTNTRKSAEGKNDSAEIWVWWFWQENRLPVLLVLLLLSLARIPSKHVWRCQQANKKN